jgi:hypothetical protein
MPDAPRILIVNGSTAFGGRLAAMPPRALSRRAGRRRRLAARPLHDRLADHVAAIFRGLFEAAKLCGADPSWSLMAAAERAIDNPGAALLLLPHGSPNSSEIAHIDGQRPRKAAARIYTACVPMIMHRS